MSLMDTETGRHLDLLAVFHYVLAALTALFSLFPVLHLAMGIWMVSGEFPHEGMKAQGPFGPEAFGWFFIAIATTIITMGLTLAGLLVMAGRRLKQRRSHTFCLVVAGLTCMNMPLGTVLGVFTLVALMRPGVKEAFNASAP